MAKPNVIRILVIAILVLATMQTGCAAEPTISIGTTQAATTPSSRVPGSLDFPLPETSIQSPFPADLNPDANFVLKTDQEEYAVDAATIAFTIENRSDRDMMTGAPYTLENFHDGAWYVVPYKQVPDGAERAWPAIGYLIPAKDTWSGTISLSEHVPLAPGRYRLVKEVMSQERENRFSVFIGAEFSIK